MEIGSRRRRNGAARHASSMWRITMECHLASALRIEIHRVSVEIIYEMLHAQTLRFVCAAAAPPCLHPHAVHCYQAPLCQFSVHALTMCQW